MCFKQYAATSPDANCDETKALGTNVKMSCFDKCLQDCNGVGCGETAEPGSSMTRLQLTGSGPICDSPVSEEDFALFCQTTGMIKNSDGEIVDDFAAISPDFNQPSFEETVTLEHISDSPTSASEGGASFTPSKAVTFVAITAAYALFAVTLGF